VVILIFAFISNITPSLTWLLLPLLIFELYLLSLGLSFLLGSINVKFRDIGSIWEVLTQALFYATPIIYPLTIVSAHNLMAAKILMLNPVAQIIQDVRFCFVSNETMTGWNLLENPILKILPIIIVFGIFLIGIFVFQKRAKYFAEEI
jgi:ABC-2 type transport system permease protein